MSQDSQVVSYQPTEGLCYDPNDEKYWDPSALKGEVERAFEICHGCRMCFKYCDAFPSLFSFLDSQDIPVTQLEEGQIDHVMNSCFQCKLCEVQCPYTPRDQHEFQLDFPKLVHRYQAQKFKKNGYKSLGDRALANPDGAAKMARASLGLANTMNRNQVHRWFLEKLLGVHRDKKLPDFSPETFSSFAEKKGWIKGPSQGVEGVLFATCYVENNDLSLGQDAMEVLQKNGVGVTCDKGLACCGMPYWEKGDLESLRSQATQNIEALLPYVEGGAKVLVINPTCSMMISKEYPELVSGEMQQKALKVAEATCDVTDFLWSQREEASFASGISQPKGKVSYHLPCHLRVQAKGFRGRDLVRKVGKVTVLPVMECCGHDGTYAMKVESYEMAAKVGKKSFDAMKNNEAEIWVTDCPLAALQFEEHAGVKPLHPLSFLAKCYREDGFIEREPKP